LSYQGEEIESRCAAVCLVDKKRYKFTEEHAVRDAAPACFRWDLQRFFLLA
jgi:hypothetical protein